ncbi:MAG: hypothetical protein IJE72_05020 [Clostridia bacterium]|nr:hypothetical protein [Clostridia bacterium]
MKKNIIFPILIALVLLSSCDNYVVDQPKSTSTEQRNTSTSHYEDYSVQEETITLSKVHNTQENSYNILNTTKTETSVSTTEKQNKDAANEEPPYASYFTFKQLKEFKNACETMNDEELNQYITDSRNLWGSSIHNRETALSTLDAIENTTIVLLDGDKSNFYEIHYHDERFYITQPVIMSETKNLVCTYYTNLSEENIKTHHENTEYITYFTDVTANGVTANVYISPNGDVDEFYAEMFVDGTRITYRVTEEQTIEEFEADFARLEFVKIGDLLNE